MVMLGEDPTANWFKFSDGKRDKGRQWIAAVRAKRRVGVGVGVLALGGESRVCSESCRIPPPALCFCLFGIGPPCEVLPLFYHFKNKYYNFFPLVILKSGIFLNKKKHRPTCLRVIV